VAETPSGIEQLLAPLLSPLAMDLPHIVIAVEDGKLKLSENNVHVFSFENIDARFAAPTKGLDIRLSCNSNVWQSMSIEATLALEPLRSKGRIALDGFRPELIADYISPIADVSVSDSLVHFSATFDMDGLNMWQADLEGSIPHLTLRKGKKDVVIKCPSLKAAFHMDDVKTEVRLTQLKLDSPELGMSGHFIIDRANSDMRARMEGKAVDVPSVRRTALGIAGNSNTVRKIFDHVKSGQVPQITFETRGSSLAELGKLENMVIKGQMIKGNVSIPEIDLEPTGVHGDVVISQGILKGENLLARLKESTGNDGKMTIGLQGKDAPFHLDIMVDADAAQIHPILRRFLKNKALLQELSLTEIAEGGGKGRLVLGESLKSVRVHLEVAEFHASGKYKRFPHPFQLTGKNYVLDETGIGVGHLSAKMGNSSLKGLSGSLAMQGPFRLELHSGSMRVSLDDIFPWLSSFDALSGSLEAIKSVKGTLAISAMRAQGPLLKPTAWQFDTKGSLKNLTMSTPLLPKPVTIGRGEFKATPEKISFTNVQANFLDSSLNIAGGLEGYSKGVKKVDFTYTGTVGLEAAGYLSGRLNVPPDLQPRAPFSVSQGGFTWGENKIFSKGDLVLETGPKLMYDVSIAPGEISIKEFFIEDEVSRASSGLRLKEKEMQFRFKGELKRETLNKIVASEKLPSGWVKGEFQARIHLDDLLRSTAEGQLEGENLAFPMMLGAPFRISTLSLDAQKSRIKLNSAELAWGQHHVSLKGDIKSAENAIFLDLDLAADGFDLGALNEMTGKKEAKKEPRNDDRLWTFPVLGDVRVESEHLKYGRFTWSPFHADIALTPKAVTVSVTKANLCRISTPGVFRITPEGLSLEVKPVAKNEALEPSLDCLFNLDHEVEGTFDFEGKATAKGKPTELLKSMKGELNFRAENGRIYQDHFVTDILSFLSVGEILKGLPDLRKEGFGYKTISVRGNIQGGKFLVKEGIIDASSMHIATTGEIDFTNEKQDMMVLVSPFKTVDFFVERIPGIKQIFGGTLVSIPVKVEGSFDKPTVKTMPPSAVGAGLLGIVKNTLTLPVKTVESAIETEEKPQEKK
jgi:hypothetical protein